MKVTQNHKLIIDLTTEGEKLTKENETDPYYEDYRRDNKLKLQSDLENQVERYISKAFPSSRNVRIKVLTTEPELTVRVKFQTFSITYVD